jgi:hypothetical protein
MPLFDTHGHLSWQNWDAISAIATAIATFFALGFSYLALTAPERESRRQRRESTLEILRSTDLAFEILGDAEDLVEGPRWDDRELGKLQAKADHGKRALEQLIQRPSLTDGAIFTGAGAIALMDLILGIEPQAALTARASAAAREEGFMGAVRVDPKSRAKNVLEDCAAIAEVTMDRAERVRRLLEKPRIWRFFRHLRRQLKGAANRVDPVSGSN